MNEKYEILIKIEKTGKKSSTSEIHTRGLSISETVGTLFKHATLLSVENTLRCTNEAE